MRDCIRGELAKLSEPIAPSLCSARWAGSSDEEIAETLGISRGNAKVKLYRARQEFKKIIEARCDFYRSELSCKPASPECCVPRRLRPAPNPIAVNEGQKPGSSGSSR